MKKFFKWAFGAPRKFERVLVGLIVISIVLIGLVELFNLVF